MKYMLSKLITENGNLSTRKLSCVYVLLRNIKTYFSSQSSYFTCHLVCVIFEISNIQKVLYDQPSCDKDINETGVKTNQKKIIKQAYLCVYMYINYFVYVCLYIYMASG